MNKGSQFLTNCSNLTGDELISINYSFSGTGAACCLVSSITILLLLMCKAYRSVLQRMFLYLMVTIALREFFIAASFEHQFEYRGQDKVCKWIGFMNSWTGILFFVFILGILFYLLFFVRSVTKGNTVPRFLQSKRRRASLEASYVVFSSILTFIYALVPYFTENYGLVGAWCWIKVVDDHCETTLSGLLAQLFQGYIIYSIGGSIGMFLLIVVSVVYCRLPTTVPEAQLLIKKTIIAIVCFLLYITAIVYALSIRIITAKAGDYTNLAVWLSIGIMLPMILILFPIGFLISFYPVTKLCKRPTCAKAWKSLCFQQGKKKKRAVHFESKQESLSHVAPTFPESSRISSPSSTFFQVPYTNDFTHITTDHTQLVREGTDTGYGSVSQQ